MSAYDDDAECITHFYNGKMEITSADGALTTLQHVVMTIYFIYTHITLKEPLHLLIVLAHFLTLLLNLKATPQELAPLKMKIVKHQKLSQKMMTKSINLCMRTKMKQLSGGTESKESMLMIWTKCLLSILKKSRIQIILSIVAIIHVRCVYVLKAEGE
jgi:hypothetical protein